MSPTSSYGDTEEPLSCVTDGHVAYLTLNRPERGNAIDPALHDALRKAWHDADVNPTIRCIVISGSGSRHFCTGADLAAIADSGGVGTGSGSVDDELWISSRQNAVRTPVIAAVNGLCNGAGLHLVVDADIVVAAESAVFMDSHVGVGMVGALENIGLAKRLPLGQALRMTLEGAAYRLSAGRAYALGLVDELTQDTDLMATASSIAQAIAANSPSAVQRSKEAIWSSLELSYQDALENGWQLIQQQWAHPDFIEGPRAFIEKRHPEWTSA